MRSPNATAHTRTLLKILKNSFFSSVDDSDNDSFKEDRLSPSEGSAFTSVRSDSPTSTSPPCSTSMCDVKCKLETKDLWARFHELGTEMIITKTGRWAVILNACCLFLTSCFLSFFLIVALFSYCFLFILIFFSDWDATVVMRGHINGFLVREKKKF